VPTFIEGFQTYYFYAAGYWRTGEKKGDWRSDPPEEAAGIGGAIPLDAEENWLSDNPWGGEGVRIDERA
jgi:hypothetical protein